MDDLSLDLRNAQALRKAEARSLRLPGETPRNPLLPPIQDEESFDFFTEDGK